jgi:uncharacterized membrane protein
MPLFHLPPYRPLEDARRTVDHFHRLETTLVHPQRIIEEVRRNSPAVQRFNGWLADHIVGLAGTMFFFYFLCLLLGLWALWQSGIEHDKGFDPFPFSFLFFILGGIMQSLFVPTMLTASNRAAERDRIKDEADHRAWTHLYEVNEEQLNLLRAIAASQNSRGVSA